VLPAATDRRNAIPSPIRATSAALLLAGALAVTLVGRSRADPVLGFLETWPGTSLGGWTGGASYSNPGTGGVEGADDGFLIMATTTQANLGTVNSNPEYRGNWRAAGISLVKLSLNDVNADEPLEIHFAIGNGANLWQYNLGFSPPEHAWQEFTVNLGSASNFTQTIGTGTFENALENVDRIQIRHDLAPYLQAPDKILGDVGIDNLLLTNDATPVARSSWGRIKALYR